jgi:hypothetical protein
MKKLDLVKTLLLSCDDWVAIDYLLKVCLESLLTKLNVFILRLIAKIQQHHGIELVVLMLHLQK